MSRSRAKVLKLPNVRAWENAKTQASLPSWVTASPPPDTDIRYNLRPLRARARHAAQNDDHARHFLRMVETNVIGRQGITLQSHARGPNNRPDPGAQAAIEEAWAEQSERGEWDVTAQYDRNGFERLALRTVAQDGEVLIRIYRGWGDSADDSGFRVQLIDPETLDIDYSDELRNGNLVRMGVEFDSFRRPVAYHLTDEPDSIGAPYRRDVRTRVSADDVLHIFLPEWVIQSRGVPWMSTALLRMHMLAGYEEAAITAARAAALKSAVYVQPDPQHPAGDLPAGIDDGTSERKQDLEAGVAEMLTPGWDIKTLDWNWPNTDHGDFTKECLRGIASGLGVTYNGLANDLEGVNYSSLRQGALAERDLWMQLQDWWISWATRPVFRAWLDWSVSQGKIRRPSNRPFDTRRIKDLRRANFQARRWPWVDPLKDIQANREAIDLRVRSVSDVIREQGRDPQEVWAELAEDMARLDALGIAPAQTETTETGSTDETDR